MIDSCFHSRESFESEESILKEETDEKTDRTIRGMVAFLCPVPRVQHYWCPCLGSRLCRRGLSLRYGPRGTAQGGPGPHNRHGPHPRNAAPGLGGHGGPAERGLQAHVANPRQTKFDRSANISLRYKPGAERW
jgi:hypothetical protein